MVLACPDPCRWIPPLSPNETAVAHVHVPAGIITVSPADDSPIAVVTSDALHVAAVLVAAETDGAMHKHATTKTNTFTGTFPPTI